jgi:deoxyribodipyrimidine photolyase-related protein
MHGTHGEFQKYASTRERHRDRRQREIDVSCFSDELARLETDPSGRRWLFVPYDQLSESIGPLSHEDPTELGIVLVENPWKAARRPYHRQKLALVLANLRHFAVEQAARGVAVRHVVARGPYHTVLEPLIEELGPMRVMRPAEYELRTDLAPLAERGALVELEHEGWLTTAEDFGASQKKGPPWRMDAFYRQVRLRSGLLMDNSKPIGGKYSFDVENRESWAGETPAPEPPVFEPDALTIEVAEMIGTHFAAHPGSIDLASLPASVDDAEVLWRWALEHCMPCFGTYEDAMSRASSGLFHTRISGLLNLHRLLPSRVVDDVVALDIPLASKEGFVRQVLGWREFIRHAHEATAGFRELPDGAPRRAERPGDGGWARWSGSTWTGESEGEFFDGGACPSALGAQRPLPLSYWPGHPSGLACLDRVVEDVWREAWSHHITRLMVLSNIAALLDVSPRELTDWFWIAYVDAYDWVVEPNVLAMGTYGVGPLMTTKPYVSGAAYINRMSDYCAACAFNPKKDCPITNLYWAYLDRNREAFADNPRMRLVLNSLARRSDSRLRTDGAVFEWVSSVLGEGGTLRPEQRLEVDDA